MSERRGNEQFCFKNDRRALYGDRSTMILALPLMLRYNNEKGYGWKYFFYAFYPLHTFALFYFANKWAG